MKKCHHQDPSLCHLWPDAELSPMSCEMTLCACSTTGPDTRTLRVFDPPKPVVVDIAIAAPSCGRSYAAGGGVSLRVRAFGARIEPTMPALLLAWLQTSNGLWRGICQMPVERRYCQDLWMRLFQAASCWSGEAVPGSTSSPFLKVAPART